MPTSKDISSISEQQKTLAEEQIQKERQVIDYDTKELTVEFLVSRFRRPEDEEDLEDEDKDIYIPTYCRSFVWSEERQSQFIESVFLGLPMPFMFMADMKDGTREVIDGAQRIQTLNSFLNNDLVLSGLKRLTTLNGFKFNDIPLSQKRKFRNQTIRIIVLSDKADEVVRREIFERINTGSDILKAMEVRRGAYTGPFYKFIVECSKNEKFKELCPLSQSREDRQEREELILRFFAYSERYQLFKYEVQKFLDAYLEDKNAEVEKQGANFDLQPYREAFIKMLDFVEKYYPYGFRKVKNAQSTPRVRFEAIAVGTNLALQEEPNLIPKIMEWLDSKEFKYHTTTHASNSSTRLRDRIEFVKKSLLAKK